MQVNFKFKKRTMLDKIIIEIDKIVKVLTTNAVSNRPHPDAHINEAELSDQERKHSLGLMRVNHCGEICAQGLYQGQALTSRSNVNKTAFEHAAFEEIEHLVWTKQRIVELGGRTSLFNPLFYLGSFALGITAGAIGDKWNLGFLEETEHQVEAHLATHLHELPSNDAKSLAIVRQMKIDEAQHAQMAHFCGAASLPLPIKGTMRFLSRIMTNITYHV